MDNIKAKLSLLPSITAVVDEVQNYYINGEVNPSESYYDSYEVFSSFDDSKVLTKNKYLTDNIVIRKIPVSTTTNISGGYTLNIGG